ncbi:MAG: hypothetical protein A2V88_10425 [Elusimicrobia bacterium RBG_16_66_12]|nr:MAG: hypothetical protein A2V88_10425 [Elusimicrobia bacterium RBG_16_66_12]
MISFFAFLSLESVARDFLVLCLVIASGLALGNVSLKGVRLGIAGVLFAGIATAQLGAHLDPQVMLFVRDFGLILFVYSVGLEVGPGFAASLKRQGLKLNLLAAAVVLLGVLLTVLAILLKRVEMPLAVGLFAGATTNTPALAAAQQALGALGPLAGLSSESTKLPGLGYAVAYPFGIIGIIISMLVIKRVSRIDAAAEARTFLERRHAEADAPLAVDLEVQNTNLDGLAVCDIPLLRASKAAVTRVLRDGKVVVGAPDMVVRTGDVVRVVGRASALESLRILIGPKSDKDLKAISKNLLSRKLVVTRRGAIGCTVGEVSALHGVVVSRLLRPDVEFVPSPDLELQYGDQILAVGEPDDLAEVEKFLGNSLETMGHPQILPVFVGIALGVLLGHWPIPLPGLPTPIRLGSAGGPLIVAILLSRLGNIGAVTWHLPRSSNLVLREMGIVLFLACVGLHAGDSFVKVLVGGPGLSWMALGASITLIPLLIVGWAGRRLMGLDYLSLCGLLAGSMTDPPALGFANSIAASNAPSIAYAAVYPTVMILRILSAQLLVLFFS